jgi:hypothetical protein
MKESDHTSPASDVPEPGASGDSHDRAIPVGVTARTTIERGNAYLSPEIYNVEITLLDIIRGREALQQVKSQGVVNREPQAGFEYVLVLLRLGYFQRGRRQGSEAYQLAEGQFAAVSADGKREFDLPAVLRQPQPPLIGLHFNPGESREGRILLEVPAEEKEPRLIFKRQHVEGMYGIWGYVWFRLYK